MHSHQMDSRDPYSRLIAQKQAAQVPMNGSYVQAYGSPVVQPQLSPLAVHQTNGFASPYAQPSPSGQMSSLSMSHSAIPAKQEFILPTNDSSAIPSSGASVATANASPTTTTTLVAPPVATTYSRLPWDRTGLPHSTSLSAEAAIQRERFVSRFQHQKVQKKMDDIKLKHRSSLKLPDWQRYGYYNTFASLRAAAFADMPRQATSHLLADGRAASPYTAARATEKPDLRYSLEKIHWKELPLEGFRKQYEIPKIPVIVSGLTDTWAMKNWTFSDVGGEQSHFRNVPMKCGEDDNGYSTKIKAKYFTQYAVQNKDDSPLYVFDSSFDEDGTGKGMLNHFEVPFYFRDDLFSLVGEARRPPYRWFLIGPERSGSSLHIDPLSTSAWNTLIMGVKRWVLFPPSVSRKDVKGDHLRRPGEDNEGPYFFCDM